MITITFMGIGSLASLFGKEGIDLTLMWIQAIFWLLVYNLGFPQPPKEPFKMPKSQN
jgi:hypothetical protein